MMTHSEETGAAIPHLTTSAGAAAPVGPVATARPAVGGGASASSVTGEVWALAAGGEVPLAGAVVSTTDGRRATTDATGAFTLPGAPPADGVYSASHPRYVASVVAGFPADAPLRLHLQSPVFVTPTEAAPLEFAVSGQVRDSDGPPLE
ncbi:MAG: hypothetical protein ACLGIN_14560, partial [Candidatus Sericytochromatia bacterium]